LPCAKSRRTGRVFSQYKRKTPKTPHIATSIGFFVRGLAKEITSTTDKIEVGYRGRAH
jgi:hypothetical protein